MATFDAVVGNHLVVSDHAQRYLSTADAIVLAASNLLEVVKLESAIGDAFSSTRELAEEVAADIRQAESRYRVTARALLDYSTALETAQSTTQGAINDASTSRDNATYWRGRVGDLEDLVHDGGPQEAANTLKLSRAEAQLATHEGEYAQAQARYDTAVEALEEAARVAASLIDAVVGHSDLNDGFGGDVAAFFGAIGGWLSDTFGPFLAGLLDLVRRLVVVLLVALVLAIAIAIAIALLPFTVGISLALIGAAVLAAMSAWMLYSLEQEKGTPTKMGETTMPTHKTSWSGPFDAMMTDQSEVDALSGKQNATVIRIRRSYDEHGNLIAVRVQIPSTQAWAPLGGPELSDLEANLVGFIAPDAETQLEKATIQAMRDANIPEGTPIVMSGFSQSGKVATEIAARPGMLDEFNITEVVIVGAADIDPGVPSTVHVTSLSHNDDPLRMVMKPAVGQSEYPANYTIQNGGTGGHNATAYGATGQNSNAPGMQYSRTALSAYTSTRESYTDFTYERGQ